MKLLNGFLRVILYAQQTIKKAVVLESNDLIVRICYQCKIHSFLQRKSIVCAGSLMVVHSQPVRPPPFPISVRPSWYVRVYRTIIFL